MRIYLSYSHRDSPEFARRLVSWLRLLGYDPWLDVEQGVSPVSPFDHTRETAIRESDFVLALLSPGCARPDAICRDEIDYAHSHTIAILAVKIANFTLPDAINSPSCFDASDDPGSVFYLLPAILDNVSKKAKKNEMQFSANQWWEKILGRPFHEELKRYGARFIGRKWLINQLNEWAGEPDSRLLVLTGEPGIGKSILAARLVPNMDVRSVHFFVPSDPGSCQPEALVSSLAIQFANQFPAYREILNTIPIPDAPLPPGDLFRILISDPLLGCRTKLNDGRLWIIVVDGLSEAVSVSGTAMIDFLEESLQHFPSWCRVIATTRPDREILARFRGKGIRQYALETASVDNRTDLADYIRARVQSDRLNSVSKIVGRVEHLAAGNFQYAVTVLNALSAKDPKYRLDPLDPGNLPQSLIDRYEEMFRTCFPDTAAYKKEIAPIVDCLVVARGGVPEPVLMAASGLDSRTALRGIGMLSQFLSRDGGNRLEFFHPGFTRWLVQHTAATPYTVHLAKGNRRLAGVLLQDVREGTGKLSVYAKYDLPYYLMDAGMFEELAEILTNSRYAEGISGDGKEVFLAVWSIIERSTPLKIPAVYAPIIEDPSGCKPSMLEIIAFTLRSTGYYDDAMLLFKELDRIYSLTGDEKRRSGSLRNQAVILRCRGRLEEALNLLSEAETILKKHRDRAGLAGCMGDQASVLRLQGDLDGAMSLYKRQEWICREIHDDPGLADSLGGQALLLRSWGQGKEAMNLLREQERIHRERKYIPGIARSQGAQALLLLDSGKLDEAMKFLLKEEGLCREIGDRNGLAHCFGNEGCILQMKGDCTSALSLYTKQEKICRDLMDLDGLATSLGNQGCILRQYGNLDGALRRFQEQEKICRKMNDVKSLAINFANQALTYYEQTDSRQASELANAALILSRDKGFHVLEKKFLALVEKIQPESNS